MATFTDFKSSETSPAIGNLIAKLLKSVAYVHHQHLITTMYSRHMALLAYYEGLPDLVDIFAEASIARGYPQSFVVKLNEADVEVMIDDLIKECTTVHDILDIKKHFDLTNPLEDIMTFLNSIRYKLRLMH